MPTLQLLRADHAAAVLAFERDNRAFFAVSVPDRGDAYFEGFLSRHSALLAEQAAGTGAYYVLVEGDGSIVGRFNLVFVDADSAELGYRVAECAAGRGVASAAVREICLLAAASHGVRELRAATSSENVASQKVLSNAGFSATGPASPEELGGRSGLRYVRELNPA